MSVILDHWESNSTSFNFNKNSVFSKVDGAGPAVLLIHGLPGSSFDFRKIWKQLSKNYHVLTLDILGMGLSDKPEEYNYTIGDHADSYEIFIKLSGVTDYHIIAHEYGALIALELLSRQYDRISQDKNDMFMSHKKAEMQTQDIKSITFLNADLFEGQLPKSSFVSKQSGFLGRLRSMVTTPQSFGKNYNELFASNYPEIEELQDVWTLWEAKNGYRVSHRILNYGTEHKMHGRSWRKDLKRMDIGVQLIYGDKAIAKNKTLVQETKQQLPNAVVTVFENCGYFPHLEWPEKTISAFQSFVKDLKK